MFGEGWVVGGIGKKDIQFHTFPLNIFDSQQELL